MKKIIIIICVLNCCTMNNIEHQNIDIIIEYAQSYKYDLKNEVFTVRFMNKSPLDIKFYLNKSERQRIIDKYYALNINQIKKIDARTGNIYIEDNCMIMPKFFTMLNINGKGIRQVIQIDTGCDEYNLGANEAKRIKKFIKFTLDIIQAKPEIKKAPSSDVIYM